MMCYRQAGRWVLLMLILIGTCLITTVHADWPMWRGPDQTGYVDSQPLRRELPSTGLVSLWKYGPLPGGNSGGWSSPVIADGCVYVYAHTREKNPDVELGEEKYPWLPEDKRTGMTAEEYQEYEVKRRDENERHAKAFVFEERLVCLDLNSGEIKWEHHQESLYTRFTQSSTPAVVDGRVFVLSPERTASCFDAATGEVVWKRRLPGDFRDEFYSSSFVVTGDVAVVACGPLYALNVSDGAILWQSDAATDYPSHSSPVIWQSKTGPIVIANTQGGQTEAWSLRDGKRLWMLESGASQSTPIVTGDLLLTYGGSRKSGLRAFSMDAANPDKTPEEKWSFQGAADQGSTPAVFGQHVFVQGEKRLAKVDLETGRAVWQETLKVSNPRYTSLVVCGNQVFYGWEGLLAVDAQSDDYKVHYDAEITRDGRLIAGDDLRRELGLAGKEAEAKGLEAVEKSWQENAIKSGPLNCASPAVSDGKIVIRLRESIVCYELTDK